MAFDLSVRCAALSTMRTGTRYRVSSQASVSPTGPAPTIRMGVLIGVLRSSLGSRLSEPQNYDCDEELTSEKIDRELVRACGHFAVLIEPDKHTRLHYVGCRSRTVRKFEGRSVVRKPTASVSPSRPGCDS